MNAPSDPLEQQRSIPTPYRFSPEDQRILKECNREAFFKRCLPCSAGLGGLTFLAVRAGYLKPHASWGPTPKVIAAVFLGYFVGKLSYQTVCAEKLIANPNSQLGAMLRARRQQGGGGSFQDTLTLELPGMSLPDEKSLDVYKDDNVRGTFTDLDTDRPYQNMDDTYQATSFGSPQRPEDFILPPRATTPNSYEEMRRKNREEFEKKTRAFRSTEEQQRQYFPPPQSQSPLDGNVGSTAGPSEPYRPTNVYGDIFVK